MAHKEEIEKCLTVRWKVSLCSQGEKCWCRVIEPEDAIVDEDGEEIYIVPSGSVSKDHAEHIVKVHNSYLMKAKQ